MELRTIAASSGYFYQKRSRDGRIIPCATLTHRSKEVLEQIRDSLGAGRIETKNLSSPRLRFSDQDECQILLTTLSAINAPELQEPLERWAAVVHGEATEPQDIDFYRPYDKQRQAARDQLSESIEIWKAKKSIGEYEQEIGKPR